MERPARRKEKEQLGRKARLQYKPLQVRALEERHLDVRKDFDHKVYIAIRVHADKPLLAWAKVTLGTNPATGTSEMCCALCLQMPPGKNKQHLCLFAGKGRMGGDAWPSDRFYLPAYLMLGQKKKEIFVSNHKFISESRGRKESLKKNKQCMKGLERTQVWRVILLAGI